MSNPAPTGYTTVAPWIMTDDTGRLLDFITSAFGGEELARVPLEDGSIGHAEIRVGDTILLAFDQRSGVEDVAPAEVMRRLSEPAYADAMRDAQETLDRELSGREHVVASPPVVR
jgi:PhnB protein